MSMVKEHVSLVDVMPTVLQLLGISPPEHLLGKSLWERNDLFSRLRKTFWRRNSSQYRFSELDLISPVRAIVTAEWKYIYDYRNEKEHLYNVQTDPLEFNNLADERVIESSQLKERLFNWVSTAKIYPSKKQDIQLTPQEKEKLKGLGYIQ